VAAVSGRTEGIRVLVGLTGGIALVVGLLILRDPLQSVLVVAMVLGVFWLIAGIVDVLDCSILPNGNAYIVMEHLVGESLGSQLRAHGRIPASRATFPSWPNGESTNAVGRMRARIRLVHDFRRRSADRRARRLGFACVERGEPGRGVAPNADLRA